MIFQNEINEQRTKLSIFWFYHAKKFMLQTHKGNNKITELRTIWQRESKNS